MTPTVSVIIVNYNGVRYLARCLDALAKQTFQDYEVIVVDNASRDDSVALLRRAYPAVHLIENPTNTGFGDANNVGLAVAKGTYIALLNNDAFPEPDWLRSLVDAMDGNSGVGICASKLILDGTDLIDSAGDGCLTCAKGYKCGEYANASEYDTARFVFGACAGAALYRRAMIDEIGFFDADFFLIHEDTDLNFRAQLFGWKCLYVPHAVVHHVMSATIGKESDLSIYYNVRNCDFVWIKNLPLSLLIRYFHHKLLAEWGALLYFGLRRKRFWLFFRAKMDVLRMLPKMIEKRHKIQAARKISVSTLATLLTPVWAPEYTQPRLRRLAGLKKEDGTNR
jgi:GT2 family glycosyltransferase